MSPSVLEHIFSACDINLLLSQALTKVIVCTIMIFAKSHIALYNAKLHKTRIYIKPKNVIFDCHWGVGGQSKML